MTIEELLALEHRGWKSLCEGTGADFYAQIMTPDAVMVLAHGLVLDRDAVRGSLNNAPPWDRYEIRDERLVQLTEDTAHWTRFPGGRTRVPCAHVERLYPSKR